MVLGLKPGSKIAAKTGNPAGLLFRRIWYSVGKSGVLGITEYRQGRPLHTCNGDCHWPRRGLSRMRRHSQYASVWQCPRWKLHNDKQEKERKGVDGCRKGSQRKQLQLARASKGKVVESSTRHLPMIRHHRSLILSVAVTDTVRSIITTTTAGSDTILSAWWAIPCNYGHDSKK